MADARDAPDVFWVEPRRRGVIPLDRFHLPRSLAKTLKSERFTHHIDQDFGAVIAACAQPAPGRTETWINRPIEDAYCRLAADGHAHSVEVREGGALVGGLYGVRIGAAFFGESMFSRATDASKAALAHLVARLRVGGFQLLDTQFITPHLQQFGATEVRRELYLLSLGSAVRAGADFFALSRVVPPRGGSGGGPAGKDIVQLLSQTS
jgi:leucyl/phenylalanyl-tRNA--protein transferase